MEKRVYKLFKEGKLLVRAVYPLCYEYYNNEKHYDCTVWIDEFELLTKSLLGSASTTLIYPNVGIHLYHSIGFLMDADLTYCHHISKIDSSSRGNILEGDFDAAPPSFDTIEELSRYIKETKSTEMNEVNVVASIDSVVGLVGPKECIKETLIVKACLKKRFGIDLPLYCYCATKGTLEKIELTKEKISELIAELKTPKIYYWTGEEDIKENSIDIRDIITEKTIRNR